MLDRPHFRACHPSFDVGPDQRTVAQRADGRQRVTVHRRAQFGHRTIIPSVLRSWCLRNSCRAVTPSSMAADCFRNFVRTLEPEMRLNERPVPPRVIKSENFASAKERPHEQQQQHHLGHSIRGFPQGFQPIRVGGRLRGFGGHCDNPNGRCRGGRCDCTKHCASGCRGGCGLSTHHTRCQRENQSQRTRAGLQQLSKPHFHVVSFKNYSLKEAITVNATLQNATSQYMSPGVGVWAQNKPWAQSVRLRPDCASLPCHLID